MIIEQEVHNNCGDINIEDIHLSAIVSILKANNYSINTQNDQIKHSIEKRQAYFFQGMDDKTKEIVAIKAFQTQESIYAQQQQMKDRINKIQIKEQIVLVKELFYISEYKICIQIMELCENSLEKEINERKRRNQPFSEKEAVSIIFSTINALYEIHSNDILHLNIKPTNILLVKESTYKLSDFNICDQKYIYGFKENINYFSPEQLLQIDYEKESSHKDKNINNYNMNQISKISSSSDVYSLGLSLLNLLQFDDDCNLQDIIQERKISMLDQKVKHEFQSVYTFIKYYMLQQNPDYRYSSINLRKQFLNYFDYTISRDDEFKRIEQLLLKYQQKNIKKDIQYCCLQIQQSQSILNNVNSSGVEDALNILNELDCSFTVNKLNTLLEYNWILINKNQFQKALNNNLELLESLKKSNFFTDFYMSQILCQIGRDYFELGKYREAIHYNIMSLQIKEKMQIPLHPDIASIQADIGFFYVKLNEIQLSLQFIEESHKIRKQLFNQNHPQTAHSLKRLGFCYYINGQYNQCIQIWITSVNILESLYPTSHPEIASCLDCLGCAYQDIQNNEESLNCNLKALKIRKILQPNGLTPNFARSLDNTGNAYSVIGKYEKALAFNLAALKVRLKLYPDGKHPTIGKSYNNIGGSQGDLDQYDKSLNYLRKAIRVYRQSFNEDHPTIIQTQKSIKYILSLV